jgi:hypothetical protein
MCKNLENSCCIYDIGIPCILLEFLKTCKLYIFILQSVFRIYCLLIMMAFKMEVFFNCIILRRMYNRFDFHVTTATIKGLYIDQSDAFHISD